MRPDSRKERRTCFFFDVWKGSYGGICAVDEYLKKEDSFKPKQGNGIGGFIPNWIGQFYAYFQWYYNMPSREVIRFLPVDFMMAGYRGLHDLDLELAVKKVGGQIKYEASHWIS